MPSQKSLEDQLSDLEALAVKNGLYDAHDWLLNRRDPYRNEAVYVKDVSEDGTGPFCLMINGCGVASWPSKPGYENPKGYAEAVVAAVRSALTGRTPDWQRRKT